MSESGMTVMIDKLVYDELIAENERLRERLGHELARHIRSIQSHNAKVKAMVAKEIEPLQAKLARVESEESVERVARLIWSRRTSEPWEDRLAQYPDSADLANAIADARAVIRAALADPEGEQR